MIANAVSAVARLVRAPTLDELEQALSDREREAQAARERFDAEPDDKTFTAQAVAAKKVEKARKALAEAVDAEKARERAAREARAAELHAELTLEAVKARRAPFDESTLGLLRSVLQVHADRVAERDRLGVLESELSQLERQLGGKSASSFHNRRADMLLNLGELADQLDAEPFDDPFTQRLRRALADAIRGAR